MCQRPPATARRSHASPYLTREWRRCPRCECVSVRGGSTEATTEQYASAVRHHNMQQRAPTDEVNVLRKYRRRLCAHESYQPWCRSAWQTTDRGHTHTHTH